jgi:hypothetical protein
MTEQNWATKEAYNWLANDEGLYNEIMNEPQGERIPTIWYALKSLVASGAMGNFTEKDLLDVDILSLASDFADQPRYEHECRDCTFLACHGKYDLYFHDESFHEFIFAFTDDGESFIWRKPEIEALLTALKLSDWNLEA